MTALPIGKAVTIASGHRVAILNFGVLLEEAEAAATELGATLVDMRWVKPLDEALLLELASNHERFVTVEENVLAGGAGSAVAEFLANAGVQVQMRHIAIPDGFIHHGSQQQNRETAGLTRAAILEAGTLTAAVGAVVSKIV
jgi:1-deoxy-D-xylulose-5-phosphate synthase